MKILARNITSSCHRDTEDIENSILKINRTKKPCSVQ